MILLRHGQSEFNLHIAATRKDPGFADPALTEWGHVQAAQAAVALKDQVIDRIITSPYARTLQTAGLIAARFAVPIIINPLVRERFGFVCDIGSPRTHLQRAWPHLDFSTLDDIWWPAIEEPVQSITARAALFRAEMAALPDWSNTLVVTHWGFIRSMTGESIGNCQWLCCDPTGPAPETEVVQSTH